MCRERDILHAALKRGTSHDNDRYRTLCAATRRAAFLDKTRFWEARSADLEQAASGSNSHWFHARLRSMREPLLKPREANIEPNQWRDYFNDLLNVKRDVSKAEMPPEPPPDFAPEDASLPPSWREFEFALGRLNNYKSGGEDNIIAEVLKYSGPEMENRLFALMQHIWTTANVPKAFRVAQLLPLWKKSGSADDPTTYRGIALLAVVGKLLARIISQRLCPHLEAQMHDIQCGFRPDRGVTDQIFVLQRVVRSASASGIPICTAFVDIEKAYDCIDRPMLFELLRRYGIHTHLITLISNLYSNTTATVRCGKRESEPFNITTGVRQGCLLSCALFNVVMDAIARQFLREFGEAGILLRIRGSEDRSLTGLLYADDLILFAHDATRLGQLLAGWDRIAGTFGLITSQKKTKIMHFGTEPSPIQLRGVTLESVRSFRYLGCFITSDLSWDTEISQRISRATYNWNKDRHTVFTNSKLPLRTRVRHFKVTVVVALLYGAEWWTLTKKQHQRLGGVYHRMVRRMLNVQWWQYLSNERVLSLARLPVWERLTASRTLRWLGHITRMHFGRMTRSAHDFSIVRPPGVPRVQRHPFKSWAAVCSRAIEIAVEYFPTSPVPQWEDIVHDRDKWRKFTSAFDDSTAWDPQQRKYFFLRTRYRVAGAMRPPTGAVTPLQVFD
jgi:hypothetical protein